MHEIKAIHFKDDLGWLTLDCGNDVPLDPVTDNNIIDLCYNKKSKILKPLQEIMDGMFFFVAMSTLYQHPLKGRAAYGVYVVNITTTKIAPKKHQALNGTYVISYNDNRVMKVRK